MRVDKNIDKAGTIEFTAVVITERPESYDEQGPIYGCDRDAAAQYTTTKLPAAKRWLRDNLKVHAVLHKSDDVLVEGNLDRTTWGEPYVYDDQRLGPCKLLDPETESIGYGTVRIDEHGKAHATVEDY